MEHAWTGYLPAFFREKLAGREDLQKAVGNTGWLFADNIVRMGIGFFIGMWVARHLGPDKFGLLNYALALVAIFSPLATLGLEDIVVRDVLRQRDARNEILGTAFLMKILGGLVCFLAVMAAVLLLRPCDRLSHWMVALVAAGTAVQAVNITECWFNSQLQAKYIVLAKNAAFIACTVAKVWLLVTQASVLAFGAVVFAEAAIGSLGLALAYRLKGGSFGAWRISGARARTLMNDSWPLFFSIISIVIYQRIDQVMLQQMMGSGEVGIYSIAVNLVGVWGFVPSALYWTLYPKILEAKEVSEDFFYARLQKFYNLMALLSYLLAAVTTLVAPWLVTALYGEAYSRASLMLVVLAWANVFTGLEIARTAFLNTMNLNRLYLVMITSGGAINVLLNLVLIPRHGGVGAAAASLVAYWFAAHGSCFLFKSTHKTGWMLSKALAFPKAW